MLLMDVDRFFAGYFNLFSRKDRVGESDTFRYVITSFYGKADAKSNRTAKIYMNLLADK